MVKKFIQCFVDDTTLKWETFLPALPPSYNTSYSSTIVTTLFKLLFREKARLLSFLNENIQRLHYGETYAANCLNLLHKLKNGTSICNREW
jgi:hypothetical protein